MASFTTAHKPLNKALSDAQSYRLTFETPDTVRKRGDSYRLRREVEAMTYVHTHTSIPIPLILNTHLGTDTATGNREQGSILMTRLPGQQLDQAWPTMSPTAQAQTTSQLKSHLKQLRLLRPPEEQGWIGSCAGGPAYDHRIDNRSTCGPFTSVREFHDFLVAPVYNCPAPDRFVARYRPLLPDGCGVVFAHADLSWENILVDSATGDVTGILDWEMAGFWPEWWEFRKALFGARSGQAWWVSLVREVMQEYGWD